MSDVIWKHPIPDTLALPEGARVIHAGRDADGSACLWEVHAENAPVGKPRVFAVVGTGHPFPGGTHLGSWISGFFVWHAFEIDPT